MKKISLYLIAITMICFSCAEDDPTTYVVDTLTDTEESNELLFLDGRSPNTTLTKSSEGLSETFIISVVLAGKPKAGDVSFTVEAVDPTSVTNGDGVTFETSGVIPAGELSSSISVVVELDNFEVGMVNTIALKLGGDSGIALTSPDVVEFTFTVVTVFKSALAGEMTATATITNQGAGIGWDDCDGMIWSGPIILERQQVSPFDDGEYVVKSMNAGQEFFIDMSFGAFYACYGTASEASCPLGDLRFLDIDNTLSVSGASQWGEVYSISSVSTDGAVLSFNWTNDYGEGARIQLTRNDGVAWADLK